MTIRELIEAAGMTPVEAARYLGVSRRTLRRYLAADRAPHASREALRRARWIAPESAEYLEYLGVLRGIEHARRCAPEIKPAYGRCVDAGGEAPRAHPRNAPQDGLGPDIQPGCARPEERREARITGLRPASRPACGGKSSVVPLRKPAV